MARKSIIARPWRQERTKAFRWGVFAYVELGVTWWTSCAPSLQVSDLSTHWPVHALPRTRRGVAFTN